MSRNRALLNRGEGKERTALWCLRTQWAWESWHDNPGLLFTKVAAVRKALSLDGVAEGGEGALADAHGASAQIPREFTLKESKLVEDMVAAHVFRSGPLFFL